MRVMNGVVMLDPAERKVLDLGGLGGVDGGTAERGLAELDRAIAALPLDSAWDVGRLRVLELIRSRLAAMTGPVGPDGPLARE